MKRRKWSTTRIVAVLLLQTVGSLAVDLLVSSPGTKGRVSRYRNGGVLVEYWSESEKVCTSYILVPAESMWHPILRTILYFMGLVYLFMGIAILADVFMMSIERITADKIKTIIDDGGVPCKVRVTVWNATVANLTLMALGSSAPEVLLSVIEAVGTLDSRPGELGPSTIVGSAAFNLLVISAICVIAVKEPKRISELGVFLLTATASLLAYVWLIVTLSIWTPCEITITEGVLTLLMFPLLVGVAYLQDRGWCKKKSTVRRASRVVSAEIIRQESTRRSSKAKQIWNLLKSPGKSENSELQSEGSFGMRATNPLASEGFTELSKIATGSPPPSPNRTTSIHKIKRSKPSDVSGIKFSDSTNQPQHQQVVLEWEMQHYTLEPDNMTVVLGLIRHGPDDTTVTAKYETQPATAKKDIDYAVSTGHIIVEKGRNRGHLKINILRSVAETLTFIVTLQSAGGGAILGHIIQTTVCIAAVQAELCFVPVWFPFYNYPSIVRGIICLEVGENAKVVPIVVGRSGSLNERSVCLVKTVAVTAERDTDFIVFERELVFTKGVRTITTMLQLIDTKSFEKRKLLEVRLGSIEGSRIAQASSLNVIITEDSQAKTIVDRVIENLPSISAQDLTRSSWSGRFRSAIAIQSGLSSLEYATYLSTLFWRVISAFIPPVHYAGGWFTFIVALIFIGMVTAVVAELAGLFGCVIGLRDPVTAITFVALGTSLPDTHASKTVAEEEDTADSAIGNITGSNCVNVFLGLGIPWFIASIYKSTKGERYTYPAGDLVYTVALYLCCSIIGIGLLLTNRYVYGGELGGPKRYVVALFLILLWIFYVVMSSLKVYGHIGTIKKPGDC